MLKEVFAQRLNRNVKFGRRPRAFGTPRVHLSDFIGTALPAPPATCDYTAPAASALADIYENDQLGDCVIAGGYHVVGVETGNSGTLFHATKAQITADYSAIGGYVPGDESTDQGCNEETAFAYWAKHGFANGTKLLGAIAINPASETQVQQALYLFENLFFGVALPDGWISPFPSGDGFSWGVAGAADPNNGHCFIGTGYNASGVQIDSWGMKGLVTWAAVAKYCAAHVGGELYALLTPDQLANGQAKAPNGVAWADLVAAFDALGGNVPAPSPAPAPQPVPAPPEPSPTSGVTLAEATAWAVDGLAKGHAIKNKAQAEAEVTAALAENWPSS